MNNNNLQKLETAIRTALPELMEFKTGCYAKRKSNNKIYVIRSVFGECSDVIISEPDEVLTSTITIDLFNNYLTIIGHPVTLLHLWRWMEKVAIEATIDTKGVIWVKETTIALDLSKPLLRDQAPNVIDELCKLIV